MTKLEDVLINQRNHFNSRSFSFGVKDRISKIKKLRDWIKANEGLIIKSCLNDYKKPLSEIYATEINPVLNHINFTLKNIKKWTSNRSVWSPIHLIGTRSKIYYEPKGVCLIISPWNYPFNLTLNPMISAIAAGNCMIIKPSEFTSSVSSLIEKMVSSIFSANEIKVIQGDANVGADLITLDFDHIFFTGSPEIGKIVMASAAKNLTSVTLELGGKNHTVVDETANIKDAAEKILWSKYVNCGQTCIAANHVFVHDAKYDEFISCVTETMELFFSNNSCYGEIVNQKHFSRLEKLKKDCLDFDGRVCSTSPIQSNESTNFPLTVIKDVTIENPILKNEIFGPILPIVRYSNIDDVIDFIVKQEKSLALYLFSRSKNRIQNFLHQTSSGTAAINECMLQYANPYLPFGGVNNSGIGKTGGKSGFLAFSNEKSVLFQKSGFSVAKFIYPPYTSLKEKLAKILG